MLSKKSLLRPISTNSNKSWSESEISKIISKRSILNIGEISHLRLDREKLTSFELNLKVLPNVTHVYLQHNLLKSINIQSDYIVFLCLSNNHLSDITITLPNLIVLDLENNQISDLSNLSPSIEYLVIRGNPICKQRDHATLFLKMLPNLKELDDVMISTNPSEDADSITDGEEINYGDRVSQIFKRSKIRQENMQNALKRKEHII